MGAGAGGGAQPPLPNPILDGEYLSNLTVSETQLFSENIRWVWRRSLVFMVSDKHHSPKRPICGKWAGVGGSIGWVIMVQE